MLGIQGILTNPAGSLGISIGNMEIAIDYLSNMDSYEPDLTEIKTSLSNKPPSQPIKLQIVKPKLSREQLINKYSIIDSFKNINDDIIITNDKIIKEDEDFEFSFDDLDSKPVQPVINQELQDRINSLYDIEEGSEEEVEEQEVYELDNSDEVDIEGFDEFGLDDEDDDDSEFDIEGFDELDNDDEDEEENEVEQMESPAKSISKPLQECDEPLGNENDSEDDEDTDLDFDFDSMLEDEDDDEVDEVVEKSKENTLQNQSSPSGISNQQLDNIQAQIEAEKKQNELLKQLEELKKENLRLKEGQDKNKSFNSETDKTTNKAITNAPQKTNTKPVDKPIVESKPKEKDILDELIDKKANSNIKVTSSAYDKYTVMKEEVLYEVVRNFMFKSGVRQRFIDINVLNEKFGSENIKKLIVKQYLIKTNKGVTTGI